MNLLSDIVWDRHSTGELRFMWDVLRKESRWGWVYFVVNRMFMTAHNQSETISVCVGMCVCGEGWRCCWAIWPCAGVEVEGCLLYIDLFLFQWSLTSNDLIASKLESCVHCVSRHNCLREKKIQMQHLWSLNRSLSRGIMCNIRTSLILHVATHCKLFQRISGQLLH